MGVLLVKVGIYPMVADILHAGHIVALEEAKKHCDYLIVCLHCCPDYKQPVQSIYERFMQLRAVRFVDEVIPYTDKEDAKHLIESLPFDIYFLGEDHRDKVWENCEIVRSLGKEIFYLPRKHPFSSSYVKNLVIDSYLSKEEEEHHEG